MGKPKLIFIVSRFPYPLEKGDKLRAYYQLIELSKKFEVTLIAISEREIHDEHLMKIKAHCNAVHIIKINGLSILFNLFRALFSGRPLQTGYFFSWKGKRNVKKILNEVEPDHIYCQLIRCAAYVKDYHNCPKTIDYMDALSKGIERRIEQQNFLLRWLFKLEYRRLLTYERTIFDYFENKTIISEQDRDYIFHPDKEKIKVISNGIDPSFFENLQLDKKYDLVFVGNLSYAPNVEAVQYIVKFILNNNPSWTCLISGANPGRTIKELCASNKNVSLMGWVDDIRESYQKGKIFIAPMMIGTGMQNKLLEAMASGLPCVTTKMTNNAIKAEDKREILVADTPETYAQIIEILLADKTMLNQIGNSGKHYVQNNFSWEHVTLPLIQIIESNQTIRSN